jgi:hypothetical protein
MQENGHSTSFTAGKRMLCRYINAYPVVFRYKKKMIKNVNSDVKASHKRPPLTDNNGSELNFENPRDGF